MFHGNEKGNANLLEIMASSSSQSESHGPILTTKKYEMGEIEMRVFLKS